MTKKYIYLYMVFLERYAFIITRKNFENNKFCFKSVSKSIK